MEHPATGSIPLSALDLAARVLVACAFGALVGIERQWHHKNAGVRTHALVSLGAAAFAIISLLGFGPTNNPMLIAGGVVTGIGFIGGGVIMHRGPTVQGINTAATLWATASMGLAAGAGYFHVASAVVLAMLFVQFPLWWLEHAIDRVAARRDHDRRG
jgi:putative Mg2+ transporter-C (MgtC) family protein